MKALIDFKDEVANRNGFQSWFLLSRSEAVTEMFKLNRADEAAELYASQFREEPQKPDFEELTREHVIGIYGGYEPSNFPFKLRATSFKAGMEYIWNTYVVKQPTGKSFEQKLAESQQDIPREFQKAVNDHFWDIVGDSEQQQSTGSESEQIRELKAANAELLKVLDKCDKTFGKLDEIIALLQKSHGDDLPQLLNEIDIDLPLIQAVIRDTIQKSQH